MEIIWEQQEVTSKDVLSSVEKELDWSRQTVKTYLDRLHKKGLICVRKLSPRVHIYYPAVSKEEYATSMTGTYLRKYFDGLADMMAGLIKNEDISEDELDDLEEIIKKFRNKK